MTFDLFLTIYRRGVGWILRLGQGCGGDPVRLHVRDETGRGQLWTIRIYPVRVGNYTQRGGSVGVPRHHSNGDPVLNLIRSLVLKELFI